MLKTEWLHDSNQCDVQYTSPLEKCKTEHYQLKLDSIWGQAVETNPVMIPIKYEIRDSAYIACIDSDEIVDTMTISDYSRKIARSFFDRLKFLQERIRPNKLTSLCTLK